jgi:prepilin-type N-terminal cleavage/methylation domain-containing protein
MKHAPMTNFSWHRPQRGFTLLELSMVLIVIALVIGAVTLGSDVQRNASYQKLGSSFVRGWQLAYASYQAKQGVVLADNQTAPTGYVKANTTGADNQEVCSTELRAAMLAAGVEMPQGRTEGKEYLYSYLDSNGNPQEVSVCFRAMAWMTESATPGTYVNQLRNVMVIRGVTPDLARMIDSLVDNARDAQFGKVREFPTGPNTAIGANNVNPPPRTYSKDNTYSYTGAAGSATSESQVAVLTLYYLMD